MPVRGRIYCEEHAARNREKYKKWYARNREYKIRYITDWKNQGLVMRTYYRGKNGVVRKRV